MNTLFVEITEITNYERSRT